MSVDGRLESGKIPAHLLAELLAALPAPPPELLLGPRVGEDACAIEVGAGVLVAAADPITLTSERIAELSVVVNANDIAVTGARPRWFLAVVLVPPGTGGEVIRGLFSETSDALERVGAHLVGGHTEVTAAVTEPVVVGQMLGFADAGRFVATGGARPGDVVVQVGPVPVEGAAVLSRAASGRLGPLDARLLEAAREAIEEPGISVVEPALLAVELGAAALHDPTEGGLAAGLHELAAASQVRIRVDHEAVLWFEPGRVVCGALGLDPWATLASGALLAAFPPGRADTAVLELRSRGYEAAVVGAAEPGSGVCNVHGDEIPWPERDEVARFLAS